MGHPDNDEELQTQASADVTSRAGEPTKPLRDILPRPEPGEIAYNAYCETRGWKSFNGDDLPKWSGVKPDIADGWRASAQAVLLNDHVQLRFIRQEDFDKMDLETAVSEVSNRVYSVCLMFEQLEHRDKVIGNGHHAAQKVAKFAETEMRERWRQQTATAATK